MKPTNKWPAGTSFDVFAPVQDLLASPALCTYRLTTFPSTHSPPHSSTGKIKANVSTHFSSIEKSFSFSRSGFMSQIQLGAKPN